jgi:DNA-binding transcriptional MocR family regulator
MTEKHDRSIHVRDSRNQTFFWIDNAFMDRYAAQVGIYGIAVYSLLCRRANKEGKCWPSQNGMAKQLGCSVDSIVRAVAKLMETGLISSEREGVGPDSRIVYEILTIPAISGDNHRPELEPSPLLAALIPAETPTNKTHRTRLSKQHPETTLMGKRLSIIEEQNKQNERIRLKRLMQNTNLTQ